MGRGIKKISENVIADKRSLTLVTTSGGLSSNTETVDLVGIRDTEAMPLGMLNVNYGNLGLSMKVDTNKWSKLDARNTLVSKTVNSNLIGNGEVKSINIGDRAVTTAKIADNAVTCKKIYNKAPANGSEDLRIATDNLQDQVVTTPKIANANVTTVKIADNAVTTGKIKDGNIVTSKLFNECVTNVKMAPDAVSTDKIQNNAVTCDKIADGIQGGKDLRIATKNLQDQVITNPKLANGSVNAIKIATNGIATNNYQNYSVTEIKLADDLISTIKLKNHCVTKEKIAPGAIDLDCLGPDIADIINRAVVHDGNGNVTGENRSTVLNDVKALGDIYARRVYNVVYMDIAEAYIPGEDLEPGDIVAMHEDGMIYKASSIRDCIVGVVSNEYASCFGASKEELLSKQKVAVGMIGQIHVKVKGPVRLGQRITISVSDAGIGVANWMNNNNIGQALETIDCDFNEIHTVLVQVRPM